MMKTFRIEISKGDFTKIEDLLESRDINSFHVFMDSSRMFLFVTVKDQNQLPNVLKGWHQLIILD